MSKVKRTSKMLYLLFTGLTWLTPLALIATLFINQALLFHYGLYSEVVSAARVYQPEEFSWLHRIIILCISAIPVSITTFIFYNTARLFKLYYQGALFENENIIVIRRIGILMVLSQLCLPIYQLLQGMALTYANPVGMKKFMGITLGSNNFSTIVTGVIIIFASWIVMEARELHLESQLTV